MDKKLLLSVAIFLAMISSGASAMRYVHSEICINNSIVQGQSVSCHTKNFTMPSSCTNFNVSLYGETQTSRCYSTQWKALTMELPSCTLPNCIQQQLWELCDVPLNATMLNPYLTKNSPLGGYCRCDPASNQTCSLYCNITATCDVAEPKLSFLFNETNFEMRYGDIVAMYNDLRNTGGLDLTVTLRVSEPRAMRITRGAVGVDCTEFPDQCYTEYTTVIPAGGHFEHNVVFNPSGYGYPPYTGMLYLSVTATSTEASATAYYNVNISGVTPTITTITTIPPMGNVTEPLPFINVTEWRETGYGWALIFFTPFFLYALAIGIVVAVTTRLGGGTAGMISGLVTTLLMLVAFMWFGVLPAWIGVALIIIASFIGGFFIIYVTKGR